MNLLLLCWPCHYLFDNSNGASKIENALFIERMIGKQEMERLNDLAMSSKAKPWLVVDLQAKIAELRNNDKE